jgi:hypothetical protein
VADNKRAIRLSTRNSIDLDPLEAFERNQSTPIVPCEEKSAAIPDQSWPYS